MASVNFLAHPLVSSRKLKLFTIIINLFRYSIVVNVFGHLTVSQLASFVYRWYILHYKCPSRKQLIFMLFLIFLPTLGSFFVGTVNFYDRQKYAFSSRLSWIIGTRRIRMKFARFIRISMWKIWQHTEFPMPCPKV